MIRVLIVDDHEIVRRGIRSYLATEEDFKVVGEASNGEEAVRMVQELRPDVVLMDLVMPGMDGVEATRRIMASNPQTCVVVLTSYTDDSRVLPALKAGARSYLLKDVAAEELGESLRRAHRGESVLHPVAAQRVLREMTAPKGAEPTERELEVLLLVAQGLSNQEIGERLYITERTVKAHITSLLSKLGLSDRTQLAIYAHTHGLVR
ncbi:MAG: response regulator transcription factor [Firmicutes bacterium]|nr:response regulator transcription factor [Bacillota bacterium]